MVSYHIIAHTPYSIAILNFIRVAHKNNGNRNALLKYIHYTFTLKKAKAVEKSVFFRQSCVKKISTYKNARIERKSEDYENFSFFFICLERMKELCRRQKITRFMALQSIWQWNRCFYLISFFLSFYRVSLSVKQCIRVYIDYEIIVEVDVE